MTAGEIFWWGCLAGLFLVGIVCVLAVAALIFYSAMLVVTFPIVIISKKARRWRRNLQEQYRITSA